MLTPLSHQKVYLTVTKNKVQLMNLIWEYFSQNKNLLSQNGKSLVVTGSQSTPLEICTDQEKRHDLCATHEEADAVNGSPGTQRQGQHLCHC